MTGADLSEGVVSSKRQMLSVADAPPTRKKKYIPRDESFPKADFETEIQHLLEERYTQYPAAFKGFLWALLMSVHLWLMIGIILAWIF